MKAPTPTESSSPVGGEAAAEPRQLISSELIAKLEAGYVLEYYGNYRANGERDTDRCMCFYRQPAYEYNGHQISAAHYSFGWGSAIGTIDERLLSLVKNPEWWGCRDMKPDDYKPLKS